MSLIIYHRKGVVLCMSAKKKLFWISALIVITALIIVLCINIFGREQISEFNGTLVRMKALLNYCLATGGGYL